MRNTVGAYYRRTESVHNNLYSACSVYLDLYLSLIHISVRILRDQTMQSVVRGLYPCGEGAGYAGGITSASMDGLKVAESVSQKYAPFDKGLTY